MKLAKYQSSFKELMITLILSGVAIHLFNFIFTKEFNFESFVCVLGATIIGTPVTYYFVNGKSFKPTSIGKYLIIVLVNILVILAIAVALFFLIINLKK